MLSLSIVFSGYGVHYQNVFVQLFALGLVIMFTFIWAFEGVGGEHYKVNRKTGELSIDGGSH